MDDDGQERADQKTEDPEGEYAHEDGCYATLLCLADSLEITLASVDDLTLVHHVLLEATGSGSGHGQAAVLELSRVMEVDGSAQDLALRDGRIRVEVGRARRGG